MDKFTGGLAGLLSSTPDYDNVIDGDLTNYAQIGLTSVTGVGTISLISVKDQNQVYPAGRRTGFVVEITNSIGGLLGADVLNSLRIRTYLNNQLRETAGAGGGGPAISLNLLSGQGKKRRLDFVTTLSFDEVELVFTGVASSSALSAFRIFYAYEEVNGCNYNCATAITTTNFPGTTATTNCELFIGTCLDPGYSPVNSVINADTTDFASDVSVLLESNWVDIAIGGADIPAGSDVGFVIEQVGLLGLIDVGVLGGITINTSNNGTPQQTFIANAGAANVGVLGGNLYSISFKTTSAFDRVRITISSVLSLATTYRIYYGFVRFDADSDDFPNCVDKCATGNDNLDADGDGIPDACDAAICNVNAGLDIHACPSSSTATLPAAGVGQTWSAVPGNPSPAVIMNNGQVTGLVNEGTYLFVLTQGSCTDTVAIHYFTSLASSECNDPISGSNAVVDNNPGCVLCSNPNAGNVTDGNLSNFVSYGNLLSLSLLGANTPLIAVKDNFQAYPAGTRVGYAVSFPGGVLSLGLVDGFILRTYRNNVLVQTATANGANVLGVDGVGTGGGIQRIYFTATQEFDEIELVIAGGIVSLDLISNINIYYAFTENAATCPAGGSGNNDASCSLELLTNTELGGMINYDRSGIVGTACANCVVDSLSHVVDNSLTNYATVNLTTGALGDVNISVFTTKVIPAGAEAGFAFSIDPNLLGVGALADFMITTYLNGVQRQQFATDNPLVRVTLIGGAANINVVGFTTNLSFDEIQLTIDASVASASVLGGTIRVYYAYFSEDSDGDGTPDCRDKCCLGSDSLDADGDGYPNACDSPILAVDDVASTNQNMAVQVSVVANDNFGSNGPGAVPVVITTAPLHGTAVVNTNGTPNDPTDDTITYTPNSGFFGQDSLFYRICDSNGDCDIARVTITVNDINEAPVAVDDTYSVAEDTPLMGNVTANDTDNDGPMVIITLVTNVMNGTLVLNSNGTFTYTPNTDFTGSDTFTYSYCDGGTPNQCDNATVTINVGLVNDAPQANNDNYPVNEDTPVSGDVTDNDTDPDGPGTTVTTVTPPVNGMLTLNPDGTFTYTPNPNFNGPDSFTYSYCDGGVPNQCDTATVTIPVSPVNDAPVANNDTYGGPQNTPVTGNVTNNDSDPDGPATTVMTVTPPTQGMLMINPDGTFTYTPNNNYVGPDSFTYSYCDGGTPTRCDTATVNFNIVQAGVVLRARVKLQGALLGVTTGNDMRDDLRTLGQIPTTEPYSAISGFMHVNGGGGEVASAAVLTANNGSNSIVDWVFAELRDAGAPATVMATRAALVQRDGDIVDVDGVSPLLFSLSAPANYFVAVRHRNHLGTMTANAVALTTTPGAIVDFTNLATPLYHKTAPFDGFEQATVNGEFALWLGNTSTDRQTVYSGQSNDKRPIFDAVDGAPANVLRLQSFILTAYRVTDVTMNGRTIFSGQNNDVNPIFNVVDSHPRNLLRLQAFVIPEQLAENP